MKDEKEKLVIRYLPLVKYVVDRLPVSFLPQVSREDLISSGVIGLLKAMESFDPSRGVKFKTYALTRIRGAIMDELRRLDWVPRSLRKKADLLEETFVSLEKKLGRTPTDKELADKLNISEDDLYKLYTQVNHFSWVSLEETDGEEKSLREKVASAETEHPLDVLEKEELREILKKALENLSPRERMIIILYYYEELTFKEIGHLLGISESRVCQIHGRVILKLKNILNKVRKNLPI